MGNALIDPNLGQRELREPLYDTMHYAAAAVMPTTISFCTHTRAVSGPQVTNLGRANQLEAGETHDVYRVRFGVLNALAADVTAIFKAYALEIIIAGKRVLTRPLYLVPLGGSQSLAVDLFEIPEDLKLQIQEGVSFQVQLVSSVGYTLTAGGGGGLGVDLLVILDGVHTVPVN